MSCAARTLDGEPCSAAAVADGRYCSRHRLLEEAMAAADAGPGPLEDDGRLARARELTEALALRDEHVAERRRLIAELRADGHPMAAIAEALGISRTRLYAVLDKGPEAPEADPLP